MRLSVIFDDELVMKDGVGYRVTLPDEPDVHAIQWAGETGEIEYRDQHTPNEAIDDESVLLPYLALWQAAQDATNPAPTFADHKTAKRAEIVAAYDALIAAGYPWAAPGGASETLQARENDLSNWLGLKDSCNEAIAAGLGDDPCPLPIRCTSNASYNLSFSETAAVMRDLRTWLSQALAVLWAKKDACRDATTQAELDAINPATGWPA